MDISHISVSRKQCFDLCQAQYRLRYHIKLEPEEKEPFYFIYGNIVHAIFEEYVKSRGTVTLEHVAQEVLEGRIPVTEDKQGNPIFAPKLELEYKKRFPGHMSSIKKLCDRIGLEGITEYGFKYDLDPPHGRYAVGFIDRLIQKGDQFVIIDYKTTKKGMFRKDTSSITKDLQLRCYARVVQRQFNAPAENIRAALYYLEGGDLIGAKFSHQSLVDAENELLETYKKIQSTPEQAAWGNVGQHCRSCSYRKRCPHYAIT
jgi:ATP-dependent helicase/DNAse subunit B